MNVLQKNKDGSKDRRIFAGRYEYQKPLGRGAGGAVYLVKDEHMEGRQAALKVLSAEACDTVQGKMLRREFEILSKLNHPNLVEVYDYGMLPDGGVYLAEEYIDGFSLQDARALLEPDALLDVTLKILEGLAYLHAMGMIHRDIKPANVMLLWLDDAGARPMVKLVDFGLSSMNPKRDTLRGGTRSYMAPEIIRGEKAQVRSDLYSLGVTLYYALCGVLPFGPRSKDDPPPTEEDFRPPEPHRLNDDVPLSLSRFTMALLRQVAGVDYADAGEAIQALATESSGMREQSIGQMANSFDEAAAPVIRGYFERGILARRRDESDLIREWLSVGQQEKSGELYLIRAPEGSGKSRLLKDVETSSKLSGHLVVTHHCEGDGNPFGDLVAILERSVRLAMSHGHRDLERHTTALGIRKLLTRLGIVTAGSRDDYIQEQWWLMELLSAVTGLLSKMSLVILIDDFDRVDEFSMQLIHRWYRQRDAKGARPAIVATARPGSVSRRFRQLEGVKMMPIEGVTRGDVEYFFVDQLGLDGLSDKWLSEVAEAADGRPSYIEEMCRHFIDEGLIWRVSAGVWKGRIEAVESMGVPSSLRQSLRRRLAKVGVAVRECVELLALMGTKVPWDLAREMLRKGGRSKEEAEHILQAALRRHLVVMRLTAHERKVGLVEPTLGEAVLDMLSSEWRRALHRRMGQVLIERWRTQGCDPGVVADHLNRGGREEESAIYFELAAEDRAYRGHHKEAIALWEAALQSTTEKPARAHLHRHLALSHLGAFDSSRCQHHLDEAWTSVQRQGNRWVGDQTRLTRAYIGWALGKPMMIEEVLEQIQKDPDGEQGQRPEYIILEASQQASTGHLDGAKEQLRALVQRLSASNAADLLVATLTALAGIEAIRGDSEASLRAYQQCLELEPKVDSAEIRGLLLLNYGRDLRRLDSLEEAGEALESALDILEGSFAPHLYIEALFELAWVQLLDRRSTEAQRRVHEALALAQMLKHRHHERKLLVFRAGLKLRDSGEMEPAVDALVDALEAYDWGDYHLCERAEVLMAIGELMIARGGHEKGPSLLQRGRQLAYELGAEALLPPVDEG